VKADQLKKAAAHLDRAEAFFHPPLSISYANRTNVHGVEQRACTQCGQCSTGCPVRAKNTLDFNYLAVAERRGARVFTQCEVVDIEERGPNDWLVECMDHLTAERFPIRAQFVFLCAGSIHSTRLLARAKLSGAGQRTQELVGTGYFPGGDALAMVYDTQHPQHPSVGPTITSTLVHADASEPSSFFMLQDGGYPPGIDRLLGMLRAPVWLGRNRLSVPGRAEVEASDSIWPPQDPNAGDTGFILSSPLDDVLDALARGNFRDVVPPDLLAAVPEFLKELQVPLLTSSVVERTIDASIENFCRTWWLTRRLDPKAFPLRWLMRLSKGYVHRVFGSSEAIADRALRAALRAANLPRAEVAKRTLGYDAHDPQRRLMLLGMGRDAAAGQLTYDSERDQLIADLELFRLTPGHTKQERLMTDIARALGGELRTNPAWAFLGKPITVHNQGGCRMSVKPEYGVTTPDGAVWGCEGLYVLDGSVLCSSVGVNPSATITAIAERNVLQFIRAQKENPHWPERDDTPGAREYDAHRQAARQWKDGALNSGWVLSPRIQPSKDFDSAPLGLEFKEEMQGYWTATTTLPPSEAEYRRCETRGRPDSAITLALRPSVADLATFFEDPAHGMALEGTVDIRLPGETKSESRRIDGRLELFVERYKSYAIPNSRGMRLDAQKFAARGYSVRAGLPPDKPETLMNYWVRFQDARGHWLLRGYKRICQDQGLDAWRDTTSLFVALFGPTPGPFPFEQETKGPIAGAGVVHMDLNGFLFKQLPSMKVLGTEDPARIVWATTKFATFFFGGLQRIYMPELRAALETLFAPKQERAVFEPAKAAQAYAAEATIFERDAAQ
jgi:hypothetical protein